MATKTTQYGHVLGWNNSLPDHRDYVYAAPQAVLAALPTSVDLRWWKMPAVYDQEQIGSCTANALAGAVEFARMKHDETPDFIPSRLFIYYNERLIENSVPIDSGANMRDGVNSLAKQGVCPETEWPYVATPADPSTNLFPPGSAPVTKPTAACYADAGKFEAIKYYTVGQSLNQMKACLAQKFPFVFGFTVYSNIYDAQGNPVIHLPMPTAADQVLGGHAVVAVGYKDDTSEFIIRNSWGPNVMDNGYFFMPYAYLTDPNLCDDLWTIRSISD
jgi:C1A family cysteine protease